MTLSCSSRNNGDHWELELGQPCIVLGSGNSVSSRKMTAVFPGLVHENCLMSGSIDLESSDTTVQHPYGKKGWQQGYVTRICVRSQAPLECCGDHFNLQKQLVWNTACCSLKSAVVCDLYLCEISGIMLWYNQKLYHKITEPDRLTFFCYLCSTGSPCDACCMICLLNSSGVYNWEFRYCLSKQAFKRWQKWCKQHFAVNAWFTLVHADHFKSLYFCMML